MISPPGAKGETVMTDWVDDLNAFVSMTSERGPGPSLAVKDNLDVRGCITTAGTLPPPGQRPAEEDAWAVRKFRQAGYHVVGKTNMHEHGLGSTNHNPHYGTALNPHDRTRITGGSSGGSAAALVAGFCDFALGSDTGGSIRIPSALCGTVGVRPTFGAVPVEGLSPLAHTLDVVGPMGLDVTAAAEGLRILGVIPVQTLKPATDFRIGRPEGWVEMLDDDVSWAWDQIESELAPVDVGALEDFVEPGLITLYSESAANHGRQLRERPESLGDDVRHLMEQGSEIPATDYINAQKERVNLRDRLDRALENYDALVLPTTRCIAPKVEEDPLVLRNSLTPFTRPFGVTGHPVLALPVRSRGLPVGIQVVGRRGGESELMELGLALEAAWGPGSD